MGAVAWWLVGFASPDAFNFRQGKRKPAESSVKESSPKNQPNPKLPPKPVSASSPLLPEPYPALLPTTKEGILASIQEAAITYDPASLPNISPYLYSPDPEVRGAAVDGVMLLGDAAGAPLLRQLAMSTGNQLEAADLRAKADYLELPPAKLLTPEKVKKLRERIAAGKNNPPKSPLPKRTTPKKQQSTNSVKPL